ncbi:hypothetical protein [Georgenia faecalis]|uniref:DUF3618 domain-containing protein n=1 Tax=Georgenia faecalis TaxID=2483799 RepID=A0ABV9D7B0_9MICO|nr:hypothetical protein [Georgenia faecalis]
MTDGYTPAGDPDLLGGETIPPTPPASSTPASGTGGTSSTGSASGGGTKDTAKQEAANVAQTAGDSAKNVVGTATEEAKRTAAEAQRQAKDLLRQGQSQLQEQATSQQQRLATGLRSLSGELTQMADGTEDSGMAAELARRASQYADQAGSWLEERSPSDLLDEVQTFARRRPGAFLAIAAGLGVVVGRLARGLKDNSSDEADAGEASYPAPAYGTATSYGTTPGYTTAPTGYGTAPAAGYGTTPGAYGTTPAGYATTPTGPGTTSSATGYTTPPADDPALDIAPAESNPYPPATSFDQPYGSGGAR